MLKKYSDRYKRIFRFVTHDIWFVDTMHYKRRDAFLIKQLKIFTIAFRRFFEDKVIIRCSALAYYSLMAIVPLLALLFAISKGLGFSDKLRASLDQSFGEQNEVIDFLMQFAENTIANTSTGVLSSLGVLFLMWSVIKVLNNIESAFNDVWQVKHPRPVSRKFADYSAFILIVPVIIAFSSTISLMVRYHVGSWTQDIPVLEHAGPLFGTLVPFVLVYLALTFIYAALPFTKVRIGPALMAALITGTAFQLVQNLYIFSQITVSKYGTIYGAFAALPLLCIWLQISWVIILFGAELSFAYQNLERYHYEATSDHISPFQRKVAGLLVARLIAKRFVEGAPPCTIADIVAHLDLPHRVIRNSVEDLQKCRLLSEVTLPGKRKSKDSAYQPALDVHRMTVAFVYRALNSIGEVALADDDNADMKRLADLLARPLEQFENSPENKLLIEI
jgi:membrane protein